MNTIIECTERMPNPTPQEAELARKLLAQVVEYLEVTYLRAGARVHRGMISKGYLAMKAKQSYASKLLLRFAAPEKDAMQRFQMMDFDL